jgi:hypothetical protein
MNKPPFNPAEQPLRHFFNSLAEDERNIIDNEIFNVSGMNMDTVLGKVSDQELARDIMSMFRELLEIKNDGADRDVVKAKAEEIRKYIDAKVFEE